MCDFIDYLGFRSSEPFAFTLTVVNGLSPSIVMENEAFPDLGTSTNMLYCFFHNGYYLTNYFMLNPIKPVTYLIHKFLRY